MKEAALTAFIIEFAGCVVFCILFGRRWRNWLRTRMGPNLFAMMFVLAASQGLGVLRLIVPLYWLDDHAVAIRFWTFSILGLVVWWRNGLLWKIQHEEDVLARNDAEAAHLDAVEAREDAAGAHEDAVSAREDSRKARRAGDAAEEDQPERDGDNTDPDMKMVSN